METMIQEPAARDFELELLETRHILVEEEGKDSLILFAEIYQDDSPECPFEDCEGMGTIYTFHSRNIHFNPDAASEAMREDRDAVVLNCYQHGQTIWFVDDGSVCVPDREWDCAPGGVGAVWVPDDSCRESCPEDLDDEGRRAWFIQQAKVCASLYTAWCNGEVYGFLLMVCTAVYDEDELITDKDAYRSQEIFMDESCCGFYLQSDENQKYFLSELNDHFNSTLEEYDYATRVACSL